MSTAADPIDQTADAMDRLFGPVDAAPSTSGADAEALDPNDPLDAVAITMDRLYGKVGA